MWNIFWQMHSALDTFLGQKWGGHTLGRNRAKCGWLGRQEFPGKPDATEGTEELPRPVSGPGRESRPQA